MTIQFSCPHCANPMSVDDEFAGRTGPCKSCGQSITIPALGNTFGFQINAGPSPAKSSTPRKKSSLGLFLMLGGIAAVGALLIAGVGMAYLNARATRNRLIASNNLKQLVIAMHNYHDQYDAFPPAVVCDSEGKQLYSGTVLLLPFLQTPQGDLLASMFDLSRAWDDPANIGVSQISLDLMIDPSAPRTTAAATNYFFVTPDYKRAIPAGMEAPGRVELGTGPEAALRLQDFTDGTSNCYLIVDAIIPNQSWAEPMPLLASELQNGFPPSPHPEFTLVAMADGSVQQIELSTPAAQIYSAAVFNDGQ